jgi:hypothetical protein
MVNCATNVRLNMQARMNDSIPIQGNSRECIQFYIAQVTRRHLRSRVPVIYSRLRLPLSLDGCLSLELHNSSAFYASYEVR